MTRQPGLPAGPWIAYQAGVDGIQDRLPGTAEAVLALVLRAELYGMARARTACVGISIGGCVDAIGTGRLGAFRRMAHAHAHARDRNVGWICIRSSRRVLAPSGGPSRLLIHEFAHLVAPDGHGPRWRLAVAALGAPSEANRGRRGTGGSGQR